MQSRATNPLLIGIIFVVLAALGFLFYRNSARQTSADQAAISGSFDINGPLPKGTTVTLFQKEAYTKNAPEQFAFGIKATDQGKWQFPSAKPNASYEISAVLISQGKPIATAGPISLTAPADDEVLIFNIPSPQSTATAILNGTITIDGYLPKSATVWLEGRTPETDYTILTTDIPAKEKVPFLYKDASNGQSYTLRALLIDENGAEIGTSDELTVTAPAQHEVLRITSTAEPPVPIVDLMTPTPTPKSAVISGTIDFNGASQQNTRIVIFERISGSGNQYQLAQDHVSPQDGATWQWNGAESGTFYDLVAVLKQHHSNGTDTDLATSQTITATAPAVHEQLTINSGFMLPEQNGQISINCGNYDPDTATWLGSATFTPISNAQSYWIQIGTTNGGNELTNNTTNAITDTPLTFDYTFKNNTQYFARYAYSYVPNLLAYSTQFSPFSQTISFTCSQ